MRKSAKWMVLLDERILELLEESEDGFMTPSKIAEDSRIPYSAAYVGQRCKKLSEAGLLLAVGNGVYTITEDGEAYLSGEYDASESNGVTTDSNGTNSAAGSDQA